jgi:hypothetical protein
VLAFSGNENKEVLLTKIKEAVVKKRSVFLYRKDLHQIVQSRSQDPERYAARIKQAAPPCCLRTDNKTDDYSANLMSSIFILGLEDPYNREKLFGHQLAIRLLSLILWSKQQVKFNRQRTIVYKQGTPQSVE